MTTKCEKCDQTIEYQGYKNYETWIVHVQLSNDQDLYNASRAIAARVYEYGFERDDAFEAFVEEIIGEHGGIAGDLLTAAIGRVDWREISEAFTDEDAA